MGNHYIGSRSKHVYQRIKHAHGTCTVMLFRRKGRDSMEEIWVAGREKDRERDKRERESILIIFCITPTCLDACVVKIYQLSDYT